MELHDRKTVLVVDDDKNVLRALDKRLSDAGFLVLTASNSVDAIQIVWGEHVDAIMLDVRMPGPLDGLSLAYELRKLAQTAHTPIIFVTGLAEDDFKARCKQAGGEYFICKPFDEDLLIRLLNSILAQDELAEVRKIAQAKRRQPVL